MQLSGHVVHGAGVQLSGHVVRGAGVHLSGHVVHLWAFKASQKQKMFRTLYSNFNTSAIDVVSLMSIYFH